MPRYLDDQRVRTEAFAWLKAQVDLHGDVLDRTLLLRGLVLEGQRVPLLSRQGIFKPRVLPEIPLSITTTPKGPYQDTTGQDGLILYSYRGTDPDHPENRGLRKAMADRVPLGFWCQVLQCHISGLNSLYRCVLVCSEEELGAFPLSDGLTIAIW